jgi:hypothetical protein
LSDVSERKRRLIERASLTPAKGWIGHISAVPAAYDILPWTVTITTPAFRGFNDFAPRVLQAKVCHL